VDRPRDSAVRLALAALLAPLGACATERKLVVTSTPEGALVRLDDTVVGSTPYEIAFDAYGTRRVTLYKQGYQTQSQQVELAAPWYLTFPVDLVTEVLVPIGWRDVRAIHFVLEQDTGPVTRPDLAAVLERAQGLRLAEPSGPRPSTLPAPPPAPRPTED
jgi:hypothetical protein